MKTGETSVIRQGGLYPVCFHTGEIRAMRRTVSGPDNPARRPASPRSEGTCFEADPTLFVVHVQLPENPHCSSKAEHRIPWKAGLSSIERCGGRVAVVVVGVTPYQGTRESRVQGEGPQMLSFKHRNGRRK